MRLWMSTRRTSVRSAASASEAGFTLLEALVALGLLSMAAAFLPGLLRLGLQGLRASEPLAKSAAIVPGREFAAARLAEAQVRFESSPSGVVQLAFVGAPETVTFVAPAPQTDRVHGLLRYVLRHEQGALRVSVWPLAASLAQTPQIERDLVREVTRVRLRYFGRKAEDEDAAWHDNWSGERVLPQLVEISLESKGLAHPALLVGMRLARPD